MFAACLASAEAGLGNRWVSLAMLVCTWVAYREYARVRRHERLWSLCVYHGERYYYGSTDRADWHRDQVMAALEELKR